ncbi:MAG: LysM peptidoglycan-binding domain-containing protein, partial [Streptomycetaceae bacterium]|nr:LysM peptidoglycan-binding domain-containing protein [Streptomycetaceae bacterium]
VSIEEISGETPGQNPTSGALAAQRVHRLRSGDTLQAVAYAEYGDPAAWRAIAELNGIDDPMRLVAGRDIMLPDPDRLGRSADGGPARGW